jgi:trans-aconitate 2-methyltransferase
MRVLDLGCGTGALTRRLADMLPGSDTLGLDSSPEMIARCEPHARAGLEFRLGTIEAAIGRGPERPMGTAGPVVEGGFDLVFSHAAIHWVDDHETLVPAMLRLCKVGGQLVVQLPSNHNSEAAVIARVVASEEPFRTELGGFTRKPPVLGIDRYAELLHGAGGEQLVVMEKVYPHLLDDADAIAEWMKGTTLLPYLERLTGELQTAYLDRYRGKLRERFPERPVFFGFRRTLFAAVRAR